MAFPEDGVAVTGKEPPGSLERSVERATSGNEVVYEPAFSSPA